MRSLISGLESRGINRTTILNDADIDFVLIQSSHEKYKHQILRLDGIYFNPFDNFKSKNELIQKTYLESDIIVFQTDFNRKMISKYFGSHPCSFVIRNASKEIKDQTAEEMLSKNISEFLKDNTDIWLCASSWRPHKRLTDNIRYFFENRKENDILIVAGNLSNSNLSIDKNWDMKKVIFVGEIENKYMHSIYRISKYFIHLAYIDHCPNVVADAQLYNVHTICASSGGTSEIIHNGTIINEINDWDFSPHDYTRPPVIDFSSRKIILKERTITYDSVVDEYETLIKCLG
jgi:hypothetical protein